MANRGIRVYADTSVFGGVFDAEFDKYSKRFFDLVREEKFQLVISAVVEDELAKAPEQVQTYFKEIIGFAELV